MTEARVPLDALHRALGAKMAGFAGWQMPIQYPTGLKAEHLHTRARAGLFDVSHMGQLSIRARDGRTDTLHRQLEAALEEEEQQVEELQVQVGVLRVWRGVGGCCEARHTQAPAYTSPWGLGSDACVGSCCHLPVLLLVQI